MRYMNMGIVALVPLSYQQWRRTECADEISDTMIEETSKATTDARAEVEKENVGRRKARTAGERPW